MKLPGKKSSALLVGFVIFLVVFAYALLTYTRRVDGTSMLPTLEQGDLVVIEKVPVSSIHVGDIIVYSAPCSAVYYNGEAASVIHRVVKNTTTGFLTKGDNNPGTDQALGIANSPIAPDCIEGKVVFVIPYIERLASLPDGLNYVLVVLIVLAAILYESWGGSEKVGEPKKGENSTQIPAETS